MRCFVYKYIKSSLAAGYLAIRILISISQSSELKYRTLMHQERREYLL